MSTDTNDLRDLELKPGDAESVTGGHVTKQTAKKKHGTPAVTSFVVTAAPLGATSDESRA